MSAKTAEFFARVERAAQHVMRAEELRPFAFVEVELPDCEQERRLFLRTLGIRLRTLRRRRLESN